MNLRAGFLLNKASVSLSFNPISWKIEKSIIPLPVVKRSVLLVSLMMRALSLLHRRSRDVRRAKRGRVDVGASPFVVEEMVDLRNQNQPS